MTDTTTWRHASAGDLGKTVLYALVTGLGYALLAYICVELPRAHDQVAPIWLSNGFCVACLLSTATRRWPALLAACLIGGLAAGAHAGDTPLVNLLLVSCNVLQILACAWGMRRVVGEEVDLGRPRDMVAFALICGLLAPIITGAVAASIHTSLRGGDLIANVITWSLGDILGLLTVTPCLLALVRAKAYLAERPLSRSALVAFAVLVAVTAAIFAQSRYPLLFMIPPVMLLVAWRLEVLGAAMGATAVAAVAVLFTMAGHGPIMLIRSDPVQQGMILQLFLAVGIFISLPVASIQRNRRAILQRMAEANAAVARSEARYRQLAENAQDMIVISNLQGVIQYASPACLATTGFLPEELVGRVGMTVLHIDDAKSVQKVVEAQLADRANTIPRAIEYRAFRKDGAAIWLESRPAFARDPVTGKVTGITDIVRDITERKALEQQLREARTEAETAAAVKGEFLANMSHELPTPLTSVLGFAHLVADQPELSPTTRRYIARVLSGGDFLLGTINDILDFSKLEAGQLELMAEPVAPAGLVRETLDLFSLEAAAKNLDLQVEGLEALTDELLMDGGRVRQVLLNLVGNAVKFTEAGTIAVSAAYDPTAQRLTVSVTDTGPGIEPDALDLLFRRFSQVDALANRKHGGTGLGLAICKGLVEAMGGAIRAESQPGHGACFTFEISAPKAVDRPREPDADAPALPAGCRVLVVDDNPANRELVTAVLSAMDAQVEEAVDGEEGVLAAGARTFDVILMDLRMPRLDGAQAAARIKAEGGPNRATPIIAFSADARPGGPGEIFDGAVSKPMTVGGLVGAIATAMNPSRPVAMPPPGQGLLS